MKTWGVLIGCVLLLGQLANAQENRVSVVRKNVPLDSIRLSDPFILADKKTNTYHMTGTGGLLWKSPDLKTWEGPYAVAQTDPNSWMGPKPMIWAAELHEVKGKYYYFATFTNRAVKIDTVGKNIIERRASHVLVSDRPDVSYTAEEKYDAFVAEHPDVFRRVPLHMVASYLGVSRETLSRVRQKHYRVG